ncbi:hypothetical protein SDC9_70894 [bioreactor metagenome]|uniref:Uncharacterized protein n=1 Tax=bioreactor metagenome TaxID=1076179 RepID=A0A644Y739_9ZZZZ
MEENVSNVSKEEAAAQIYKYAASLLIDQKRSPSDAKRKLMEKGLDEQNATIIIDSLHKEISTQKKARANKDMLFGALWCIGGIVITAATYSAASGGGTYVVAWGAIIFGAIQFFKGLANL